MDRSPLVREEIEAGADVVREFDKYAPVKVAFWLKASDDPYRYLYIVSESVGDADVPDAYGEVVRIANDLRSPYFDPFHTKIVAADHPLAVAAAEINEFPLPMATRLGGTSFGGVFVDDVYVYPPLRTSSLT